MDGFRIRSITKKDLPTLHKLIIDGWYEYQFDAGRISIFRNWKLQVRVFLVAMLSSSILFRENCFMTFITFWLLENVFLFLAVIYSYRRSIKNYIPESMDEAHYITKPLGFWVGETHKEGQWKIVGCIALYKMGGGVASCSAAVSLERMSVTSKVRGRGFGSKLLQYAISQASNMNFREIILDTSDVRVPSVKLYLKHGSKLYPRSPWPIHLDY
uniref:uncharacterized protein LOC120347071 n=1 Tax=Styela clava TaxID=7725 RepID=UPI0019394B03|nr:uncharacterized protein LOC120347071 [Styela clava]